MAPYMAPRRERVSPIMGRGVPFMRKKFETSLAEVPRGGCRGPTAIGVGVCRTLSLAPGCAEPTPPRTPADDAFGTTAKDDEGPAPEQTAAGPSSFFHRGARIRTGDPLLPKQVRYRTAPRPVVADSTSAGAGEVSIGMARPSRRAGLTRPSAIPRDPPEQLDGPVTTSRGARRREAGWPPNRARPGRRV